MNTRTVTFSYITVKNGELMVPVGPCSLLDIVKLIRESFFKYMFRDRNCLMSDECLTSSIGQANFFAGALGGYETRLKPEDFAKVKELLNDDIAQALAVVRFRNPNISDKEAWLRASKNDVLSVESRDFLAHVAKMKK